MLACPAPRAPDRPAQCQASRELVAQHLQVVVASCNEPLGWTAVLSPARVLVLEQCNASSSDGVAAASWQKRHPLVRNTTYEAAATYHRVLVQPNRGREAHAFLWYIVHYWEDLAEATVFLQGDATRHGIIGSVGIMSVQSLSCPGGALEQLAAGCWAFLSLAGPFPGPFAGEPLSTKCRIYRDFAGARQLPDATVCQLWEVTTTGGNFAAHRDALRLHPRETYRRWLRTFESQKLSDAAFLPASKPPAHGSASWGAKVGASLFERSWAYIFGCARLVTGNCSYSDSNATAESRVELEECLRSQYGARGPAKLKPGWLGCERGTGQRRERAWERALEHPDADRTQIAVSQ